VRKAKQYLRETHNRKHPKRRKKAIKADRKLKTIARRLIREIERELSEETLLKYSQGLTLFKQILDQKRGGKNKIYSIHKPFNSCIAKGESHKQYEFGTKVGLLTTSKTLVITAIKSFKGNPHNSKTIGPLLKQTKVNLGEVPKELIYDRAGKGQKEIGTTKITTPDYRPLKRDTENQKKS
jgi:IS5 family transposase